MQKNVNVAFVETNLLTQNKDIDIVHREANYLNVSIVTTNSRKNTI